MSNPSLILPQSPAYGEDYVYAAQVEDGAVPLYNVLPLTFTRASGGTRINKDGILENMPYNLLEYSEDFTNGVWQSSGAPTPIISANTTIAPNGTTTADTLVMTSPSASTRLQQLFTFQSGNYVFSIYVKSLTGSNQIVRLFKYDGVNETNSGDLTVTNEWTRITYVFASSAGSGSINIRAGSSLANVNIAIWGAQVNIGSTAQPYLATTDRLNMPRITYPVGGGCGALLLEKQSTNLLTYSEDFTNVAWTKYNGNGGSAPIITANYAISPDGTQNADRIQLQRTSSSTSISGMYQAVTTSNVDRTLSVWLKSLSGTPTIVVAYDGTDYQNTITLTTQWTRHILNIGVSTYAELHLAVLGGSYASGVSESADFLAWGYQFEESSYATSYIPTTSTSATRIKDACYKTAIGSLIGTNQGSIYVNFDANGINNAVGNYVFDLSDGSNFDSNRIAVYWTSDTTFSLFYGYGGTFTSQSYTYNFATTKKIAVRWTSTQIQMIINGVAQTAVTYGNSSPTKLNVASRFNDTELLSCGIKECILFNTTQSTSDLIALTTI